MIQQALQALVDELNAHFRVVFDLNESQGRAMLSAFVGPDGTVLTDTLNKLCVTLINIEPESTVRNAPAGRTTTEGEFGRLNPALRLNLKVLLAANFSDYTEALKFLSGTLALFQRKNLLTAQNTPTLDRRVDRLILEMESTTAQEWSFLWGMLGSKYVPSVVYKVRLLTIQEGGVTQSLPVIGSLGQQTT
ncbi:DUF4255 domain-containing protein [Hymenobacter sp. BT175]|uniref:DUF4255 domain-containing protein n=1 Tax=Hymenobacter translucens TaxID=2886507 RepID=UPI001D0EA8C6|nr:DUF4255 domain-containing protein [Hymenobacter translucens]MCC2545357.1 DUF4255 domain-containing protein [Hymenobacter translucens]